MEAEQQQQQQQVSRTPRMSIFNANPKGPLIKDATARKSILIQYSNIPVGVPFVRPSSVRGREETLEIIRNQYEEEMEKSEISNHQTPRSSFPSIRKHDNQGTIDLIVHNGKKTFQSLDKKKKKKGSMFISELWGSNQLRDALKKTKLAKDYETIRSAETQGLWEKLDRMEETFEKGKLKLTLDDPASILEQFKTTGVNQPALSIRKNSPRKVERNKLSKFATNYKCNMEGDEPDQDDNQPTDNSSKTARLLSRLETLLRKANSPGLTIVQDSPKGFYGSPIKTQTTRSKNRPNISDVSSPVSPYSLKTLIYNQEARTQKNKSLLSQAENPSLRRPRPVVKLVPLRRVREKNTMISEPSLRDNSSLESRKNNVKSGSRRDMLPYERLESVERLRTGPSFLDIKASSSKMLVKPKPKLVIFSP